MGEITKEHLEKAAPALQDEIDRVGLATTSQTIMGMFDLSPQEAAAGVFCLISNKDIDSVSLGIAFREAIESAGSRDFPRFDS